ncbi:MAG: succinylglutamate desuccinylase/aspartoacylase family protein [Candidatus Nanohaloarchaea archaeon]|nr:succinylglutamate desuccinylase/aspartoacylase family protein [Candidatus Nanohaloarchaea archaeon]
MIPELDGVDTVEIGTYEVYDGDGAVEEHTVHAYEIGDGPVEAFLVAGSHGDEIGSQYVADELVKELAEEELDVSVAVVPDTNIFAQLYAERGTSGRFKPDDPEQDDLNRVFETVRKGLDNDARREELHLTQQLGYDLLTYLEDAGDDACLVDMHTAAHPDRKMPQVRYKHAEWFDADEEEMRELAEASGLEYLVAEEKEHTPMLAAAAPAVGIPAVTIEIGGAEKPYDDRAHFREEDAELYKESVRNILKEADVLPGEPPGTEVEKLGGLSRTYADTAGDVIYHREPGEAVASGETVAELYQDGELVETYEARVDGVLEGRKDNGNPDEAYDAWATQGMRLFNVAELDQQARME